MVKKPKTFLKPDIEATPAVTVCKIANTFYSVQEKCKNASNVYTCMYEGHSRNRDYEFMILENIPVSRISTVSCLKSGSGHYPFIFTISL